MKEMTGEELYAQWRQAAIRHGVPKPGTWKNDGTPHLHWYELPENDRRAWDDTAAWIMAADRQRKAVRHAEYGVPGVTVTDAGRKLLEMSAAHNAEGRQYGMPGYDHDPTLQTR